MSLLPLGRRGGVESGLLNAPRLSSLLLGFASRLSCSLGSFRGRSLRAPKYWHQNGCHCQSGRFGGGSCALSTRLINFVLRI